MTAKHNQSILLLALLASSGPGLAHAQQDDFASLSLARTVARALERNPMVVESTLEWRRTQAAASGVAGVLVENPLLSAESGVRRDQGWSGNQPSLALRVEQPLDLLGQAQARRQAASDVVTWARARLSLARVEIAARAHTLYVAAQVAQTRVALCQERLATAEQTALALEMRVRLGASSDIDLQMARAEVGRAEASLADARAQIAQTLLALRDLLELPAQASALPSSPMAPPPTFIPTQVAHRELVTHHAAVQVVEKRRLAIDSEIARLERERMPRLSVGFAMEVPSERERFFGMALSISPALWRRNQGPLAEARVERERADWERATTLAHLERRLASLGEEQAARLQELQAVERTLASEETVRTLVRAGWQAGKFDFLRVLLAERSVADTKQTRLALWADLWTNVIEINRLIGQEP